MGKLRRDSFIRRAGGALRLLAGVLALLLLLQDTVGIWGRTAVLRPLGPSPSDPTVLRLKLPDSLPDDARLRRQVRIWQGSTRLHGPTRSVGQARDLGAGSFAFGGTVMLLPVGGMQEAERAEFRAWVPRAVPAPVRWLVYGLFAGLFLLPPTRAYFRSRPAGRRKLPYLEAVRGLACVVVVLTHFLDVFYPGIGTKDGGPAAWYEPQAMYRALPFASLLTAGEFAVSVFFVLSGFVLFLPFCHGADHGAVRLRLAVIKRPVRLFGIVAAVMVGVHLLNLGGWPAGAYYSPAKPAGVFLRELFLTPYASATGYNAAFWTIRLELLGSFGIFGFAWLFGGSRWRPFLYGLAYLGIRETRYVDFLLGMILADAFPRLHDVRRTPVRRVSAAVMFLAGLIAGGCSRDPGIVTFGNAWLQKVLPDLRFLAGGGYSTIGALLVVSSVLISATLQRFLAHRWLATLGRLSYSIYGVHGLILCSVICHLMAVVHPGGDDFKWSFEPDGAAYHFAAGFCFAVYLAAVFAASCVLTAFVDEPCTRFSGWMAKVLIRTPGEEGALPVPAARPVTDPAAFVPREPGRSAGPAGS
jgi:peptidoglycan/LPS O-acetylase OafA/YrhL